MYKEQIMKVLATLSTEKQKEMQGILKTLGLYKEVKPKERKKEEIVPLPEYDLKVVSTCKTCGTVKSLYYHMTWKERRNALYAIPVDKAETKDCISHRVSFLWCKDCFEALNVSEESFKRILGILPFEENSKIIKYLTPSADFLKQRQREIDKLCDEELASWSEGVQV